MNSTFAATPALERPEPGAAAAPAKALGRRPRLCFVAPTTWPLIAGDADIPVIGGAELQQTIVATALAQRGCDVSMISMDFGQQEGSVVRGVRMYKMHAPDAGLPVVRFLHPRLTSLWRAMGRANADVYYHRTAGPQTAFIAAFCRRHGKRSIQAGASDVDFIPGRYDIGLARDRWLYERGLSTVDAIFAQTPRQVDNVRRHYGREAILVPNCYSPPAHAGADPGGYVLWCATVRAQKRPEIFLELARRLPRHRFMLVGGQDGDRRGREYAEGVRAAARQLPNMAVRGFTPFAEAERLFDGARVIVNTSPYEGFPNTFLQAWARGIPTVSFVDTGSRHRGQAVYEVARDVDHATALIARLMDDDEEWSRSSRIAAEHFHESHSPEAVLRLYEAQIERLAAPR
jgi:glycosyltransferase involved in cell wall biosynthesis